MTPFQGGIECFPPARDPDLCLQTSLQEATMQKLPSLVYQRGWYAILESPTRSPVDYRYCSRRFPLCMIEPAASRGFVCVPFHLSDWQSIAAPGRALPNLQRERFDLSPNGLAHDSCFVEYGQFCLVSF